MENAMIRFLIIFLFIIVSPLHAEEPASLSPYTATYSVKYRGFKAGLLHFTLTPAEDNTYIYETRAEPGFLASLIVSREAYERSVVQIDENGVRPLTWVSEDGKKKTEDDGSLTFDWTTQQVSGVVEDEPVTMSTEPGLQDRLSMQIAVLTAMLNDTKPGPVTMIDGDRIKKYSYERKGMLEIKTAVGNYNTILYESTRPGSSRFKRIYHAPELGYIPVLIETFKKGKRNTVIELIAVKPAEGAGLS
jgi:hypothetical protein